MKKSELKQFIREEIISTLSEAEQGVIHTKDQRKAEELAKKGLNVSIDEKKKSDSGENSKIVKIGQTISVEGKYPGIFVDAEVTGVRGEMISYTTKDGDFGNLNVNSEKISIDEKKKSEEDEDVEVKDDWNKVDKEDSFVEKEPSAKDLKKGDKVTKMAAKLAMVTKEMKSVVSQWKKAEGNEKDRLLNRLKELTKVKKELDAFITPTIGTDED